MSKPCVDSCFIFTINIQKNPKKNYETRPNVAAKIDKVTTVRGITTTNHNKRKKNNELGLKVSTRDRRKARENASDPCQAIESHVTRCVWFDTRSYSWKIEKPCLSRNHRAQLRFPASTLTESWMVLRRIWKIIPSSQLSGQSSLKKNKSPSKDLSRTRINSVLNILRLF